MKIWSYILKRLVSIIPVFLGVTILTFFIANVIPGDPVTLALGHRASEDKKIAFREKMGMDKPIIIQYGMYLNKLLHGDLGVSLRTKRPVLKDLLTYFPATIELTVAALALSLLLGIPLGIISAAKKDKPIDHATRVFALLGVSMPIFWLGFMLLILFYMALPIFPGGGRLSLATTTPQTLSGLYIIDSILSGDWAALKDAIWHLIMPAATLGFTYVAVISRMTRSSMLEVLRQDYIRTAKTKGLSESGIIRHHALRNSIIPVVTVSGALLGQLMSGSVLAETVFNWPGIGFYAVQSIIFLDFNAIIGFTIVVSFAYVMANFVVDILYAIIDPRIKLQ